MENELKTKQKRKNGFSPAGKALGIVSLCLFWLSILGLSISIPGLVMSNIGLKMAQDEKQRKSALTGKVCSAIALTLNIITFLVFVVVLPVLAANGKL